MREQTSYVVFFSSLYNTHYNHLSTRTVFASNTKKTKNDTPLHYAAPEGHMDIVELLINWGADVNASNNWVCVRLLNQMCHWALKSPFKNSCHQLLTQHSKTPIGKINTLMCHRNGHHCTRQPCVDVQKLFQCSSKMEPM